MARAADLGFSGTGQITLSPTDPLLVLGQNTKFSTEIKPKSTVALSKPLGYASAEVDTVLSDTELRLKRDFAIPSKEGAASLKGTEKVRKEGTKSGGLAFKILPHVDQHEMYGAVYKRLKEGQAICIFPEGSFFFLFLFCSRRRVESQGL